MSTAITQRPVTTSSMIGGQILSQKQRRQVSRKQQQQQRKANDEEAINRIIKEIKIIGKSNSYPNIVNFYVVTSALSKCLLFLQNTDLGSIPLYLKNNFAERSIINEKIAGKITGFNKYVLRKDQINNNTNTTNFVTSRRRSRLLSEKPKNLHIKDKQLTTTESSPLSQKTKSEEQELEHPLVEAVSKIIIDALSETDNFGRIGAEVYKYLDKCDQESQNLFDLLFVQQQKPRCSALLGVCDQIGIGTSLNEKQAFESYEKAAEGGDDLGQYLLALCYFYGRGIQQNFEKSFDWFTKSAESDNAFAQSALGLCYFKGCGTVKDDRKAFYWYSQSSINGKRVTRSQNLDDELTRLKINSRFGFGTARDQEKVFFLHHRMAQKGDVDAQCVLGYIYQKGVGIPQDLVISFYWYNKSAQAGSIYGQYNLACCYEYGLGIEKNVEQAIHWYQQALNNGYEDASKPLERLLAQQAACCVFL